MKSIPRQSWVQHSYDNILESLEHGETLVKFIATDPGTEDGDFSVEIHGLVKEDGTLIICSEKVTPQKGKK